ncbi:glycosyltransferase, CAZy family GT29 [Selaginella moellendorffii]|uniref:Glycosyltransferase, CAZy family GT29 n=1 Tax=Selaginella moellendorffii TaxID=88036 RepID=D8R1H4_SELML|nr:glycosyltransferase, CAZy family GT29 [Selaginella moellendorffii]
MRGKKWAWIDCNREGCLQDRAEISGGNKYLQVYSVQRNEQFKIYEPLEYEFDVCETLLLWEQYRNVTTILTREYLDARPGGWMDYAAKRIAQLGAANCSNRSLCEEHLELILPPKPPFWPRQFRTCAVVGNSGDLLKTEFGKVIDAHDIVIRDNEAPVTTKYAKHVGMKRSFRLMAHGVVRNLLEVATGSDDEVLIIKSVIHRDFNAKIKLLPNPVYLFQGVVFRRGAKGTGIKSLELALSMCNSVDMYGFTGHNPLQGRAYYQLLECLGTMRLHSPMREARKQDWSVIPTRPTVNAAYYAAMGLKRKPGKDQGAFKNCKVWGSSSRNGRLSGSKDMSETRKNSNYAKWEKTSVNSLRSEAQHHYRAMEGVTMYKIDGNKLEDLVCIRPQQLAVRHYGSGKKLTGSSRPSSPAAMACIGLFLLARASEEINHAAAVISEQGKPVVHSGAEDLVRNFEQTSVATRS